VWRRRTLLAIGLAALGLVLLVGFLGASSSTSASAPPSASGCHVHYHPIASCAVPTGNTIDICSLLTDGVTSCPITEPDLNPADWISWLSCSVVADASALWAAIVGDVDSYLTGIFNDLVTAAEAPFNALLSALSSVLQGAITDVGNLLVGFFQDVNSVSAPLGPLAPLLTVTLTLTIFLVAGIALYFAIIFLIAFSKTVFNLL
jgi:hypothetical protein